ncbi:hypothetical protein LLG07_03750 [bacterium]|nr:hypothetical protein [bacterium]
MAGKTNAIPFKLKLKVEIAFMPIFTLKIKTIPRIKRVIIKNKYFLRMDIAQAGSQKYTHFELFIMKKL